MSKKEKKSPEKNEYCCALCKEFKDGNNIIREHTNCFVMFNRYPYLPGAIMIVPKRSKKYLYEYSKIEIAEIFEITSLYQKIIQSALDINSTNIGINNGPNSGCSIPQHLHIHIVPRRSNDHNFMQTTVGTFIKYPGLNMEARKIILNYIESNPSIINLD